MNWISVLQLVLTAAPQEIALIKAVVDAIHAIHATNLPNTPAPSK